MALSTKIDQYMIRLTDLIACEIFAAGAENMKYTAEKVTLKNGQ